jgi:hypothetical protein
MGRLRKPRLVPTLGVALVALAAAWAPPLAAQAVNGTAVGPLPPTGAATSDPGVFRRAAEEAKEREKLRPKAVKLRTREDTEREGGNARDPSK